MASHRYWHSRGYLPHFDNPACIQGITFRLADSLPQSVLDHMARELENLPEEERNAERQKRIAIYLDSGHGECLLRDPRIAEIVEDALLYFDAQRYRLLAWCVMPNHVHVLAGMVDGWPLGKIVHSWKSFTAHEINHLLDRNGSLWYPDYYDRFIRDEVHYAAAVNYLERNPVKARLVSEKEDWRWSSAWSGRP